MPRDNTPLISAAGKANPSKQDRVSYCFDHGDKKLQFDRSPIHLPPCVSQNHTIHGLKNPLGNDKASDVLGKIISVREDTGLVPFLIS